MKDMFANVDYWKAIILYGLNQATYKIALGKTLLDLAKNNKNEIDWHLLSKVYFDNYLKRLEDSSRPQQSNPARKTVMERIVKQYQLNKIDYDSAISKVGNEAFHDVIPRFQNIGTDKSIAHEKFYHFIHGKKLILHDSVFEIHENHNDELIDEINARWSLLEGAFTIVNGDYELRNDIIDVYLLYGYERTNITKNIPFLQGYQGNLCFYCAEKINKSDIHVDHVLPRQVLQHDEIWNLVLSHSLCNLHKSDSLIGKHYLEKLLARNENIIGSNHPWKKKIIEKLGMTTDIRAKSLLNHYENTRIVLRNNYWENSPNYNKENDPFFKQLITKLNNR
tara:strand:- start:611 stop:1618 length:1008 start_codon:yes stop_codon:yes gene_type:complete